MTTKSWIIFGAIVAVLFGALVYQGMANKINVDDVDETVALAAEERSGNIADHTLGNKEAKVTIIEYGDYQCPGCKSAYEPLKTVTEKYEDDVLFVFRNFPLTNIHPNARAASAAAETAGLMGKYWEMHDLLYQNQDSWGSASASERMTIFVSYAAQIGLDNAEFENKLSEKNADINKKIDFDAALGKKVGVSGTPAIYINGEKISDQRAVDGKLTTSTSEGSPVWSSTEDLEKLIILPALKKAGVDTAKYEVTDETE